MLFKTADTPTKSKTIAALERDLEAIRKRRETLAGKLDRAALAADRAAASRRHLVLETDEPDSVALANAEAACRAANETLATLEDANRHAAEQIRALELNLADQIDRATRGAEADRLERAALGIDVAAGDFRDALDALAGRYAALIDAMRAGGPITSPAGIVIAPELAAMAALDAGIRQFERQLVPRHPIASERPAPTDAAAVVQETVSAPLRHRAAAIRSGGAAAARAA